MKIAFFEIEGWEKKLITAFLPDAELYLTHEALTESALPEENDFEVISVFIGSRVTKAVLDRLPKLKCVATRSTGYDHIDIAECKKRGIAVQYVPGYGDNTVAEFAFGLLLNLIRKIYQAINQIKEKRDFALGGLRGCDLRGKTLGIVGTGRIGTEMIKMAKGFNMNVIAYDPFPRAELASTLSFTYVTLEKLLGGSDFISLHCPYTSATHHLINKDSIALIKRGSYIINTARGGLIETEALVTALTTGIFAGAALDVLEGEDAIKNELEFLEHGRADFDNLRLLLENNVLIDMPNVLITPHAAFDTDEAVQRILATTLENIKSLSQSKPLNVVL